jgi:hypothetical protein
MIIQSLLYSADMIGIARKKQTTSLVLRTLIVAEILWALREDLRELGELSGLSLFVIPAFTARTLSA